MVHDKPIRRTSAAVALGRVDCCLHVATPLTPALHHGNTAGLRLVGLALLVATACTGNPLHATTGHDAGGANTPIPYPDAPSDLASTVNVPDSVTLAVAKDME